LREYIAFTETDSIGISGLGQVLNQNLHALPQAEMLIISHHDFLSAANRLADIHRSEGLKVNVVTPLQIFNEFSSGSQDLIAMRSFIKMFYDRASSVGTPPKYVLMLGDASYMYKDKISGNTNFVPAFQSTNSVDPVNSHVSDDYFGFLDDSEGEWRVPSQDRMDIAIGRFPVQTLQEAEGIVDKIVSYYSANAMKDWRNKIVFVGDDEDGVVHMSQANDLSKLVDQKGKDFNTQKIFLDAYQQQATASGARYPEVTSDLVQAVEDGALFLNYTGHGGETGWTAERILGIFEIMNFKNIQNLPVFLTATCEFSRFDDPLRTSGGELLLLNPDGGGIGLMTTTRLVFSSPNYLLNRSFYDQVFEPRPNGEAMRLGDIFLDVKNFNAYSTNSRNFSLLGDPAVRLAIPKERVVTTEINGKPIAQADTLNALSTVTISGIIADDAGNKLNNFNGFVYPTVFDKIETKRTLNNDGGGVFSFETRERRIFKGKATVTSGDFTFTFVVPKDISYSFGNGKISYYAENQQTDANGYSEDVIIGGSNPNLVQDDQGPQMELYLNDENFVYGGLTDENPRLLLKLKDDQGINTVGSGIGHDIVATVDGNSEKSFILNDFYEAAVDDHTKGAITYPLLALSAGKHTITVKAWDVANNSSEKTIEFTVVKDQEVKIENLVNYPNPFTTNTEFIFQHNQAGVVMDIKLEVFTVSGKLVKSIDQMVVNQGFISKDIRWDGRDDFGDKIGKGVYMYKLKVRSANGSTSEKIEKLVIL
ncbi:MAG: type IX secretion system sortase PorU, partial [Vicingaceae bacterium]